MPSGAPFRALSLDLWFTSVYHLAEDAAGWDQARVRVLREHLVRTDGARAPEAEIAAGLRAVTSRLEAAGRSSVTTDPEVIVRAVAERLGAQVDGPSGLAAREYSAAGLRECPPRPNPEAESVVRTLGERGISTVLVTNSARRAATWSEFLLAQEGPQFRHVVSSCDLGVAKPDPAIFREAARVLGVPAERLLHVGDRWELDVVGALAAGCGAALYRGLWDRYPRGLYPDLPEPPKETGEVRVLDHLQSLLEPSLWRA